MAPPAVSPTGDRFGPRIASALIIAVPAISAIYAGTPYMELLVLLVSGVLAWEWENLCSRGRFQTPVGGCLMLTALAAVGLGTVGYLQIALIAVVIGSVVTYGIARFVTRDRPGLTAVGAVYVGLPCLAFIWLRADPAGGRETILWLVAVVVAMDIGGYVFGRTVGGPRLAPRISPKKTWAGLLGGMASAALVGGVAAQIIGGIDIWLLAAASAVLAAGSQAGDLLESAAKRSYGIKDMSSIIPGHGGVFDRLDGMIAAAAMVAAVKLLWTGGKLTWQ